MQTFFSKLRTFGTAFIIIMIADDCEFFC